MKAFVAGVSIAFILLMLINHGGPRTIKSLTQSVRSGLSHNRPIPSPFPFQELTIPYLRSREYKSTLGERNVTYQNSVYTAYLTSYQSDGLKINGLLTEPAGEKPPGGWPAIVFVHGYIPPSQYATLERYVDYVDYLARSGFIVFKIDLRGHGDSEGESSGAYYSSDYITDTLNAVAALQSDSDINPKKIGLWGHSMAGNVTLRSLAAHPTIPAVAIWSGAVFTYSDRMEYGIQDGSYVPQPTSASTQGNRLRLRNLYGEFDANSPFWKQVTPTNYLNDIKGAISLHAASMQFLIKQPFLTNFTNIPQVAIIFQEAVLTRL